MGTTDGTTKKNNKLNLFLLLLLAFLFIAVYTVLLQKNYSNSTLKESVEHDKWSSDMVHRAVLNLFTKDDFTKINDYEDMKTERYKTLQSRLNDLRLLRSVRYLYTAKRAEDGELVYLIDGLDYGASDFAYPGTAIEDEMIPYINAALSGETIYSPEIVDTT